MATSKKNRGRPPKKTSATATEITRKNKKPDYSGKMQMKSVILFTLAVFLLFVVLISGRDEAGNICAACV